MTGKLITVGNLKGGVGKSTVTVNLAVEASTHGQRVCIVDCDPQLTSANWLVGSGYGVHVVAMPMQEMTHAKLWVAHVKRLAGHFDMIIIDLPAVIGPALASAMLVSHLVLVPLSLTPIDIHGTQRMLQFIVATASERPTAPPEVLIVPNRVPAHLLNTAGMANRLKKFRQDIAPGLRDDPVFADVFEKHCWVGDSLEPSAAIGDVTALANRVRESLANAADAPVLTAKTGLFARLTGKGPPIGDLGYNHKEGLVWWKRLLSSG